MSLKYCGYIAIVKVQGEEENIGPPVKSPAHNINSLRFLLRDKSTSEQSKFSTQSQSEEIDILSYCKYCLSALRDAMASSTQNGNFNTNTVDISAEAEKTMMPSTKWRHFIIDTPDKLNAKLKMVEALGEIQVATKLLENTRDAMISTFECFHDGWGVTLLIGVPAEDDAFKTHAINLLNKGTLKGSFFRNYTPHTEIPNVLEKYMKKGLEVEKFITHQVTFSDMGGQGFNPLAIGDNVAICGSKIDKHRHLFCIITPPEFAGY